MAISHFPMWALMLWLLPSSLYAEVCSFRHYGDVRLRNGSNNLEGRVEVCVNGLWGRVGGKFWDLKEANIVCRQLGFSVSGHCRSHRNSHPELENCFGRGTGTLHFASFDCRGGESRLIDCMPGYNINVSDTELDAGVRCDYGSPPQNVSIQGDTLNTTITWTPPNNTSAPELLIRYEVTCSTASSIQLQILVENTTLNVTFENSYNIHTCCVVSVYEDFSSKDCIDVQNTSINISSNKDATSTTVTTTQETTSIMTNLDDKKNMDAVGGVLGFIIIVLVILLVLACLALAYPRCIRPRIKERGHLSSVRGVLDRTLHNPMYDANDGAQQQQNSSTNISTNNPPSMQSNALGHEYETIDSRITKRNRQRNQLSQLDHEVNHHPSTHIGITGSHDQQEVSHDPQDESQKNCNTASSGQYDIVGSGVRPFPKAHQGTHIHVETNTSYDIPDIDQNRNGSSDIDPTRYEVSEAYLNAAGSTNPETMHTVTDEGDKPTGPELDSDGYAHLEH